MRKPFFFIGLILFFSCTEKEPENTQNKRINTFDKLLKEFSNPSAAYKTAPFWDWNNDVSVEDIDRTLTDFKEKGIGGAFLHPRYGLITEYLSADWWKLVGYTLKKAKELDINIWIYDENSFPSGFAGGLVPALMPGSNSEGVALKPYFLDTLTIPSHLERVTHVFKMEGGNWIEITASYKNEIGATGKYCLLDLNDYEKSKWFAGYSYIDLLKPGVTDKFIEITMPGYEKTLGSEFGKRVPGVFTDEPNTNTRDAGPIRYTPDLYEQFEKLWGYRLEPHLMSLIAETGDWKRVRHNYYSTILQLFIDRWSKPWFSYTESKNLAWTGHYWEHGWPSPAEGPDNMAMYAWHQQPAIDMLFNAEDSRPDQFGNVRAVKELSSVANQFGRHRTLSETYGAAGWELTFEDMKRLGDWEYVLGVNFMVQHLAYISIVGDRKHDFPQGFGPYAPYWDLYKYQADYFARLSVALSSGVQQNHILVLEPTSTAWMYYNPTSGSERMVAVGKQFESFLKELESFQVEYDLGCENILKGHGQVNGKNFIINKASYNLVVLPPGIENLDGTTAKLLNQYLQNGGKVISFGGTPVLVDGNDSGSFRDVSSNKNWNILAELTPEAINNFFIGPDFSVVNLSGPEPAEKLQTRNIFHTRRDFDDGQLLFFANFDKTQKTGFLVSVKGKSAELLDLNSGDKKSVYYTQEKGKVNVPVWLDPAESILLFVHHAEVVESAEEESEPTMEPVLAEPSVVSREKPNILNLDYVELTVGKYKEVPMYFYQAGNIIWQHHGFEDNPWVSSSQFKTELVDADTFPEGSGFQVEYPFEVGKEVPQQISLVVEQPWLYTVSINNKILSGEKTDTWLDPDFYVFDISGMVKSGQNKITLKADPFSMYCELEPVYLLGNFSVGPTEKGWEILPSKRLEIGSWKNQGLPFYGQSVCYTKNLEVQESGDFLVRLPDWQGTVAEVLVDGKHAGIIQAKPYSFDLDGLTAGQHQITVKIIGSLKNTLGPHHNVTERGIVTPWSFKFAPEKQPSGEQYDLLDYGLMKDFEIFMKVN